MLRHRSAIKRSYNSFRNHYKITLYPKPYNSLLLNELIDHRTLWLVASDFALIKPSIKRQFPRTWALLIQSISIFAGPLKLAHNIADNEPNMSKESALLI